VLSEAAWQRCYVHFLRNALDYVPRKVDDDCLQELRWFGVLGPAKPDPGDRRDLAEVRRDIAQWLAKWQTKYPRLCNWVEDNIEETLTCYRLPLPHHKHMKSTDEVDKRIFWRGSSLSGRGRPRGEERGIWLEAAPGRLVIRALPV
jgi:putative transposase